MTEAGRAMLMKFLDAEAKGHLTMVRDGDGKTWGVIRLETSNGAQKATAEKLKRDGLADMQWTRSLGLHKGRYLWITEAGRLAMREPVERKT